SSRARSLQCREWTRSSCDDRKPPLPQLDQTDDGRWAKWGTAMTRPARKRQQSYNERRLAELQKQVRHEQQLMTLELDALAGRIGDLEEAYAKLPRWARSPTIMQRFVLRCVHEIEAAFAKSRMRVAARLNKRPREIPRFTQLLVRAFAQLEAN